MKIIFNPTDNKENQYIHLMVDPLVKAGFEIHPLDNFLSSYQHMKSIQLVHLNWFEVVHTDSFFTALRSFFRKLVVLFAIRLSGKPLVWTMHNRNSHEQGMDFFSKIITNLVIKWADRIIIHSHISKQLLEQQYKKVTHKTVYIPHPNFIRVYGPIADTTAGQDPDILRLLFIGIVKPYKNIELLIQIAKQYDREIHLTIAGKPTDASYKQKLEALAENKENIHLRFQFIRDEEIPSLLGSADLLVLPYDMEVSLNSGTVILGFSYKKTVICPNIGTITDIQEERQYTLAYSYQSAREHANQLKEKIAEAIQLKKNNPHIFKEWGDKLFQYVQDKHDNKAIGEQLIDLYRQVTSRD